VRHACNPIGSEGKLHAGRRTRTSGEPVQGYDAPTGAGDAHHGPGESALGTVVDARHLAATPVGQHVTAEAEVTELDGRRNVFAVTARDEVEEIGRGTHERMVPRCKRIEEAADANEASRKLDEQQSDVVILDNIIPERTASIGLPGSGRSASSPM
jgi:hypothetical protein